MKSSGRRNSSVDALSELKSRINSKVVLRSRSSSIDSQRQAVFAAQDSSIENNVYQVVDSKYQGQNGETSEDNTN